MSSDLFVIGQSGVKTYRAAMSAISENITNANTANFSRRSITTRESASATATAPLYASQASFGGVEVGSVNRANDPYLDATVRLTGTALGSADARLRWQTDIETALNDGDTGVGHLMSNMYSAIEKLAANPNDASLRTTVLYGMQQVVDAFHQTAGQIGAAQQGIATTAQGDVSAINNAITELGRINGNLLRSQPGTSNQAQLLDSRDAALAEITKRLDVTVSFGANGAAELRYGGQTVLSGMTGSSFAVSTNSDGTLGFTHEGAAVTAPGSGSLGGLFQSATVARQRLDTLDNLSDQFASDMNGWHAQGVTDAGNAGGALFTANSGAATLALAITGTADIAARSSDGKLNGNLLAISSVRGTGGAEQGWTALVAAHATMLNATTAEQTAASSRDTQARGARDNVSGVDLDMEAADLLRTQQAYSGCAKIIQIAKETVDAILQIL